MSSGKQKKSKGITNKQLHKLLKMQNSKKFKKVEDFFNKEKPISKKEKAKKKWPYFQTSQCFTGKHYQPISVLVANKMDEINDSQVGGIQRVLKDHGYKAWLAMFNVGWEGLDWMDKEMFIKLKSKMIVAGISHSGHWVFGLKEKNRKMEYYDFQLNHRNASEQKLFVAKGFQKKKPMLADGGGDVSSFLKTQVKILYVIV